nr:MAG: ORF1 [TTV-like mini virus]
MPPFRRRWNNYRKRPRRWRKNKYGFWRPRNRVRRYRRRTWVRKRLFKKRFKKLKYIKINQWQPQKIRKCKIQGYLELFETSFGRVSNNYVTTKESYIPEHYPGGGGWSIQQLSLGNLYVQNLYCNNYWTRSNKGLNLCRYFGVNFYLYRQPNVDWIFTYNLEEPLEITKYTYASYHPYKMLQYKKRIIIPSYETAPLKKRKFYKIRIKPPKKLTNQWYFQNHLQNVPLVTFFACACDLTRLYVPKHAKNNNVTLWNLNTKLFEHPRFQDQLFGTQGFRPDAAGNKTLWGLYQASEPVDTTKGEQLIYLGNPTYNLEGQPIKDVTSDTQYTRNYWGSPFHTNFITNEQPTYLLTGIESSTTPIKYIFSKKDSQLKSIDKIARRFEETVVPVRYNPNKDKGIGNMAYFLRTDNHAQNNWEPPADEELIIKNFPLWLMLWGFSDYVIRHKKINNLDVNGILVIRSEYLEPKFPSYVLLSDDYVNGVPPWGDSKDEMSTFERGHWFPRWELQKQAIENLLMTGPAVSRPETNNTIQAHIKYCFFFKWGGNPSSMEVVWDPNIQPVTPDPTFILQNNEIISPATGIENYIYNWETRRDLLTQAATERISQIPTNEQLMFTDGASTSTDIPQKQQKAQAQTTEEEEETSLFQQLLQLQQHNEQLQQRFRQLKQLMPNM